MLSRRKFLEVAAAAGSYGLFRPIEAVSSRHQSSGYFGLHQFIEDHPEAVFIMRTNVDDKMNSEAKLEAGLAFGRSVFVPKEDGGLPLTTSIPVKPNLKTSNPDNYPLEDIIGTVTDPYFMEGTFEGIKELGVSGSQFHLREVNRPEYFAGYGYVDMAERVGADLRLDLSPTFWSLKEGRDYNWLEVPDSYYLNTIPKLEPISLPDTWLLNVAKFKAHGYVGLTLATKNLQGTLPHNYQRLCCDPGLKYDIRSAHKNEGVEDRLQVDYERHIEEGIIPRWDRQGPVTGLNHEYWVNRTLDNISVTPAGLHVIEGIYGRDGDSGTKGPHPLDQVHEYNARGGSSTGHAEDFMANKIIFGKDNFRVDIIGHWLAGYEPGNMSLFHLAIERGFLDVLNPRNIPVYLWDNGTATLIDLETLDRTPLLGFYLTDTYELTNEPYDYGTVTGIEEPSKPDKPEAFVLHQNRPNPFNPYTTIEYRLPSNNRVRLEIYNSSGQLVDVLVDGYRRAGTHMAVWNTGNHSSGAYFYRFRYGGYAETKKMLLLR